MLILIFQMRRLITTNLSRFSSSIKSHYDILGVQKEASEQDIKAAYYKLAKKYHPDLHPHYANKFKEINEAYNTLKDPAKKYDYDSLFSKAAGKENVSEVKKSHYNTHFHYGYTDKFKKSAQERVRYESNPFATNYEKAFSNEFTRNMFKKQDDNLRKQNLTLMSSKVQNTIMVIFSLIFILLMTEMMLDLYAFNHQKQKTIPNGAKDVY